MVKPQMIEPSFQGTRGTHGDSNPKDWGSKASMGMYRNRQLSTGVGLPSKNPRLINMNLWQKPRNRGAAKWELNSRISRTRSLTKSATASGTYGERSCVSPEHLMLGVKQEPKDFELRLPLGTPITFVPARIYGEMKEKIGSKLMPQVILRIGLLTKTDQKWCPLPVALLEMDVRRTYL